MGEMAAGFAHELNQPLTAIVNYAQGGLRRQRSGAIGDDEFVRVMELVVAQAYRAGAIIRRIRRFVQKDQTGIGAVDVNATIREAVGLHEQRRHGTENRDRVALGGWLAGRHRRRGAVAAGHSQLGAQRHRGDRRTISRRWAAGYFDHVDPCCPGHVEVLVVDSGPGIPEDVARQVFEPFFTTKIQGMGMGLAICRSIVESSGGRLVLADPTPGRTTFRVLLPVAEVPSLPV